MKIDRDHNWADNSRHMAGPGGNIAYTISPEEWNGLGLGTPQGQDYTIDGTVPAQETPAPGDYRDTLIVTVDIVK